MVASRLATVFQMTNDRLNRLALFQTFPDASRNPAPLSRDVNRTVRLIMAAIAAIHKHFLDTLSTYAHT